ncbi:MAG TPA: antirestriction protein ArdA [Miltoncostaeaceae bacterium]|nr:antirestriction protein ArdA [Miltoncostaeaceae bacterium]
MSTTGRNPVRGTGGEHRQPSVGEIERTVTPPRIYVASLGDYNEGRLHGVWIEAAIGDDELYRRVRTMLAGSPMPGAEEWAIHDFEGFCGIDVREHESLPAVGRLARGIVTHGAAFAAFVRLGGAGWGPHGADLEAGGGGGWDGGGGSARHPADDLGLEDQLDRLTGALRPYVAVDYDLFARDLGHDISAAEAPDGGVFVFDLNR